MCMKLKCFCFLGGLKRDYHLIATSSKDGHIRIFKLTDTVSKLITSSSAQAINATTASAALGTSLTSGGPRVNITKRRRMDVELVADFADHQAEVWRVEWNVTGTVLSSSGDDGKIRLWKGNDTNQFWEIWEECFQ